MSFPTKVLTDRVRSRGIELGPYDDEGWAVPLTDALQVCEAIAEAGYAVLGGEYWLASDGVLERLYEVWAASMNAGELWEDFVRRSYDCAVADLMVRGTTLGDAPLGAGTYVSFTCAGKDEHERLLRWKHEHDM